MRFWAMAMMVLALTACDATRDTSQSAANVSKQMIDETTNSWRDLFTFRPRPGPQDPQTRFCYQMQSDIVCYDTPQTHMTSKLVGYQDGEHISYIQKGGGSMGVSVPQSRVFNAPSSYAHEAAPVGDVMMQDMGVPVPTGDEIRVIESNPTAPVANANGCAAGMTPFECKESGYVKGAETGR